MMNDDRQRLRRFLMVVLLFQLHNSICTRHYLHRPTIVSPSDSKWQQLYEQADPSSFLHMMGLTRRCFAMLLSALFDPDLRSIAMQRCVRSLFLPGRPVGFFIF
jgi:hypothetical protein